MRERFTKYAQMLLTLVAVLALVTVSTPQLATAGDVGVVVDLVLLPSSQTVDVDDIFDITIQAQCNGQDISTIAAFINFDPAYLEVQSVTPGTTLPTVVENAYNNTAGTLNYQAGKLGGPFPSDTFTVATVSLKALDETDSTPIIFSTTFPRNTDADFGGTSKLDELFGATVTIGVVNNRPVLSNGQVNPDPGYVTTDFTYSVTYTDDDNDPPSSPTVSIDGGGPIDMTEVNPGDTDYTDGKDYEYTTSGLAKDIAHTYQFAASDGIDDATGDTASHDGPNVQNSLPTAPVVDVTPDSPVTTDNLVCTVTTPSTDPDAGDTITYTYEWYKDGVLKAGLTTDTVDSSNTAKGEVWRCVVTPNDGTADGPTDEDEVTIQNTPPVLSDGIVSPTSGDIATDFTYSVTYTDADNDPPASPTVSIDGGGPIGMTEVNPVDTVYTDGKDYEYTTSGLDKGSHTFQFAASDGVGDATGDTGVHTGPGVENTAPVLSAGQVNPDSGYVTTDFIYSVTYTDDDNDPPISITVTIDSGAPQDMTEVDPGDTDYTDGKDYEYTTSGLAKDIAHIYQFAASDGVDDATGDTGSHDGPTVQNSPPTAPVVDVTPDSPVTTDDLVCTITTPSTDPDAGDTVTYTYEWYKDGVLQAGLITDTVDSTNTAKGEVWKCVVTPNDGTADGSTDEDQVTIGNSPPTAPVVDVTPDSAVTTDDLVCTITTPSTDPDAGDTVTYTYEWYKDGVLQAGLITDTVDSSNTAKGEVWRCVVTPNDGTADGSTDEDQVTIGNSPPTAPVVDVTPDSPVTTDDLVCTITTPSTDPDAGDTITYTYEWYKDGVIQAGLTTDTVDSSNTAKGEAWRCVVTPNDGTADGPTDEDEVTILNSPPVANAGPDQMALIGTNVTLDGSGSSDADGDPLEYSWTQIGGSNVTLSNPTAVNATFTPTEAGNYTFSLVVNDGIDYSPADTTVIKIKASNIAPVLSDGIVSPTSGYTSTTFTYSVVYTDDDNDAPMSITVTIDGGGPQDMNIRSGGDGNYTNSEIYEYTVTGAVLGTGSHTFQFAASDGIADATGDVDVHAGPTVSSGGGGNGGNGGRADTRAPSISNIESCDCTKTGITIKWKTGESGTSRVEYWASAHIFSPLDESLVRYHEVKLTNLKPCCEYHFRVISEDSAGNKAISEEQDFTTMGTPATFTIGALSISPAEVQVGESITISVLVTNTGDAAGTYEAILKIDNAVVATESVTIAGGASEEVNFTTSKDVAGTYTVSIGDQSGTVVVTAFTISALDISPAEVNSGGDVNISALITNTGNVTSTYEAILKIDDAVVATQNVTLAGGANEEVAFTISKDVAGTYTVDLNGLTGTFVIKEGSNWWLIGGIIAGVVVAVLLVLYFRVWRKRRV